MPTKRCHSVVTGSSSVNPEAVLIETPDGDDFSVKISLKGASGFAYPVVGILPSRISNINIDLGIKLGDASEKVMASFAISQTGVFIPHRSVGQMNHASDVPVKICI